MEISQNGIADELATEVYRDELTMVSAREHLAYVRLSHWRQGCYAAMAISVGLLVALVLLIQQRQHQYTLVGITEEGHVRLTPLVSGPWTLDEKHIRDQLRRWIHACRSFGTDDIALAQARVHCLGMTYKQAEAWAQAHFQVLPVNEVRKVAIRVAQPPLPPMRFVPPSVGRTWEVYWQEEWSVAKERLTQRKAFLALITVYLREPTSDEEAKGHLGVWIEHITMEERPVDVAHVR